MKRVFATLLLLLLVVPANAAVVFIYHRFGESEYPSTNVTLAQFEAQLDFLAREGYSVWPLPKLVTHLREREPVPDKVVVITIDDAYASVFEHAYPALRKRGMPFTVFVATDAIDRRLPDYMSWDQLRELHAAGVTIANHGTSHDHLVQRRAGESEAAWQRRIRAEVVAGQVRLQAEIGDGVNETPRLFAYPFGEYDLALMKLLEQMGYVAFGQHSGPLGVHDDLRALPRFPVNEKYGEIDDFSLKAATLPLPVLDASPRDPLIQGRVAPVLQLRLGESAARLEQFGCYFGNERMAIEWQDATRQVAISTDEPLPEGRSRYNCTAPHRSADRWYWYSHPWINAASR